jgi:exo-beta-1,3-glucanase (GH17 family)/cellulose synthase/poly-beta-1,6-N-acetylglucosamine synthase-like glycosyltransferase
MLNRINLLIMIAVAVATIGIWAYVNQPTEQPPWPRIVQGFSFSPFRADEDAIQHILPTDEEIDADLALLEGKTHAVRTYSTEGTLADIPRLAKKHNINVTVGAWIDADLERNEREIARLIEITNANRNVVRVIVGNEVLLHNYISKEQLIEYLDRVRQAVKVPVSTADTWYVWYSHLELEPHVDYVAAHLLPYWEKQPVEHAVAFAKDKIELLRTVYPNKPVIIGEVGWPSDGRTRGAAVASQANQAMFLRQFLKVAEAEKYTYYIMEAFDQPWKGNSSEGAIGAYWGVYDVERQPKFSFTAPIVGIPHWGWLAGLSVVLAIIVFSVLLVDSKHLGTHGRSFLGVIAYAVATAVVWVTYDYSNQYLTLLSIVVGLLMVLGMTGVIAVLLAEAHEWAELRWSKFRRREFVPLQVADAELAFVSIHVPCYNEPPDMMLRTLDALAALDYPHFEVIVIDNNTQDDAVWQPVQTHCLKLGEKFRFYHENPLPGFKAGALNYALQKTSEQADVIAVIDSDYVVAPNWLRELAPQFVNPKIAVVQAPQDYSDSDKSLFKSMCHSEYAGFFQIGMITRNERNAIIQHGTMTMIRRQVLQEVGGWAEWTITEDAELGLRVFEHGYEAVYIPKSYGQGLMPDTFIDFKKQRSRWAFGAMQILRGHARQLLGLCTTKLTTGQRYHFIAGWLPWLADGLNLVFNIAALAWTLGMIISPAHYDPPLIIFSMLPLILFSFKTAKQFHLYQTHVNAGIWQTLAATIAGIALSHTISRAILAGFVKKDKPFFRTPKLAERLSYTSAFVVVYEEVILMLLFILAIVGVLITHSPSNENLLLRGYDSPDLVFWLVVLCVQTVPYLAAIVMSLLGAKVHGARMTVAEAA